MMFHRSLKRQTRPLILLSAAGMAMSVWDLPLETARPALAQSAAKQIQQQRRQQRYEVGPRPIEPETESQKLEEPRQLPLSVQLTAGEQSSGGPQLRLHQVPQQMPVANPSSGDQQKSEVQRRLEELYQENGREIPQMFQSGYSSPPVQAAATGSTQNQTQIHPVGRRQVAPPPEEKPNIFERFVNTLRGGRTSGPPQDPGMDYVSVSEAEKARTTSRPMAPPAAPAAIPPRMSVVPPAPAATQPGLFQAPPQANPIAAGQPVHQPSPIPPAPGPANDSLPTVTPKGSEPVAAEAKPQLKLIFESQTKVVDAPAPPPKEKSATDAASLPTLDFSSASPEKPVVVAPAEPAEKQPAVVSKPAEDPFANLFPDDKQTSEQSQLDEVEVAQAPVGEPEVETQPYTGLTLNEPDYDNLDDDELDDLDADDEEVAEQSVAKQSSSDHPLKEEATQPVRTAQAPLLMSPALPSLNPREEVAKANSPALDLTLPGESSAAPKKEKQPVSKTISLTKREQEAKMQLIKSRKGMSGLKGFCPVSLRDDRELIDASEEFEVEYHGKQYQLSSWEARERFLEEPMKYAPAAGGADVIHLASTGERKEGSLDHAVWYKGRLYLFRSAETMETFVAAPSTHATEE